MTRGGRPRSPDVPEEIAEELRELHTAASRVNGPTPKDHPDRRASEALSAILASLLEEGYTGTAVARALGIRQNAVQSRLARHGYAPWPAGRPGRRYGEKEWQPPAPRKDRCKHDHEMTGENLGVLHNGTRYCKACDARRTREYLARKRATRG